MSPEKQRIAIAKACGIMKWSYALPKKTIHCDVPHYLDDLNAMHEAEKVLNPHQLSNYCETLMDIDDKPFSYVVATASQRAEAFLKTLGLWEEE